MKFPQVIKSILVVFFSSVSASCSTSDSATSGVETGSVSLLISDAPSVGFGQINLTLESCSFIPKGDDEDGRDHDNAIDGELKLEIFDDKVLAKTEHGFQLWKVDAIEAPQRGVLFCVRWNYNDRHPLTFLTAKVYHDFILSFSSHHSAGSVVQYPGFRPGEGKTLG